MAESFRILDLGDRRVLTSERGEWTTRYSERVIRLLIERKGVDRAPLYFPFKETRAPLFLDPLFRYLRAGRAGGLRVLEVGCSFGHMTEYLAEQPEVLSIATFDTDPSFVLITRAKVEELHLHVVREVRQLDQTTTCRLPWPDGAFDLVVVVGIVEHLPVRHRRQQVDEYSRVVARGGHVAILDTPNRAFPVETHSIGLPFVHWLPPRLAWRAARGLRPDRHRGLPFDEFEADGTGWRNATLTDCLPSSGLRELADVTEEAGYGWRFFRATARSRARRASLPVFAAAVALLRALGQPPSLALPYLNLVFRKNR